MPFKEMGVWFPAVRTGTGAEIFTIRLVNALKKRGIRAEITWLPHYAEYLPWVVPVPVVPAWVTVVHVNTWLHSRFIPKNLPVIATMHSAIYDDSLLPYKSLLQNIYHQCWIRACERWCIDNSKIITAVSHYAAAQITKHFGRKDIRVIHNWVDLDVFHPGNKKNNEDRDGLSIVFVGSTRKLKGFDLIPRIMRKLGDSYQLQFTTDDPNNLDYPNNMIPVKRINNEIELASFYRNADLLLFPSRLEGFGLVALEAQACGIPVVATNGTALPEVISDGVSGILCPQDDVEAFVEAIKKLADDVLRLKMGKAANQYASNHFSELCIVDKYIDLYSSQCRNRIKDI